MRTRLIQSAPVAVPRRARMLGLVALLAMALPFLPSGGSPAAHAAEEAAVVVGTFKPTTEPPNAFSYGASSQNYIDAGNRVLYNYSEQNHWVAAYDADTLKPIGAGLATGNDSETAFFSDPNIGGLFVARSTLAGQVRLEHYVSKAAGVVLAGAVDLTTQLPGRLIVGAYKAPGAPRLWVLAGNGYSKTVVPGGVRIVEVTLTGTTLSQSKVEWAQDLAGCPEVMHNYNVVGTGFGYYPETHSLYFACSDASAKNNTDLGKPPSQRGAGQLVLNLRGSLSNATAPGQFNLYPHSGEFAFSNSYFDATGGRLGMGASAGGSTFYVFDVKTASWVGGISLGANQIQQDGLDPASGRYYALSPTSGIGLVLSDMRTTPVAQGWNVPSLNLYKKNNDVAANLAVDSKTHRIFLKYANLNEFVIVHDVTPPYNAADQIDPDVNTVDLDESPGKTTADFLAGAQGYGSVIRQVGGYGAVFTNVSGISSDGLQPVGLGTREFRQSYIDALRLNNDEASGRAISADADRNATKYDLSKTKPPNPNDRPAEVDQALPSTTTTSSTTTTLPGPLAPVGQQGQAAQDQVNEPKQYAEWPYEAAECNDFGDKPGDSLKDGAFVSCHASEHVSHLHAEFGQTQADNVIISDSLIDATTYLDKARGVVSTVHVESRGITILGGVLRIGEVIADGTSWAKGRPGTANSTYKTIVKNVQMNGQLLCDANCDPNTLADQINKTLQPTGLNTGSSVQVSFPGYDPTYFHGSKRGYQALIRSSPAVHLQDVTINQHPDDRLEVPGMAIYISQDNQKPGRTIVLLSGLETEAHYGISPLDDGGLVDDDVIDNLVNGLENGGGPLLGIPGGVTPSIDNPGGGGSGVRSSGGPVGTLGTAGKFIFNGLRRTASLLPIWAILLVPVYLSARRWLLLQRSTLIGGRS